MACADGAGCVPQTWWCDGETDCADGSDEAAAGCGKRACPAGMFPCASGRCLPADWRCDGAPDCPAAEDEASQCTETTPKNEECSSQHWRCDGVADCEDASDELTCVRPPALLVLMDTTGQYTTDLHYLFKSIMTMKKGCENNECVTSEKQCIINGICQENTTQCANKAFCVPSSWWCDGISDCADSSDELSCQDETKLVTKNVTRNVLNLTAANCGEYRSAWRCDGIRDCMDGADEKECAFAPCTDGMFRCGDGTCLPMGFVCDSRANCPDGADEHPQLLNSPCHAHNCSQVCTPKHNNYSCRCTAGYRLRHLADGNHTCEFEGDAPLMVVCSGGWVHVRSIHRAVSGPDVFADQWRSDNESSVEISGMAAARIGGDTWLYWGDTAGRLRRARLPTDADRTASDHLRSSGNATAAPLLDTLHHSTLMSSEQVIRGVAIDPIASRVYWTAVPAGGHRAGPPAAAPRGVLAAPLDLAHRALVFTHHLSDPGDIVVNAIGGYVYWCEMGALGGIWRAGLAGAGARPVAPARRASALALNMESNRLYFADGITLMEMDLTSVGASRPVMKMVLGMPPPAPSPKRVHDTGRSSRSQYRWRGYRCRRLASWAEWVWCGSARGLARLARRPAYLPPLELTKARAGAAAGLGGVTALLVLPPQTATSTYQHRPNTCAAAEDGTLRCGEGTVCVRSGRGGKSHVCLCPLPLVHHRAEDTGAVQCVKPPSICPHPCLNQGICYGVPGTCACAPGWTGERCQTQIDTHKDEVTEKDSVKDNRSHRPTDHNQPPESVPSGACAANVTACLNGGRCVGGACVCSGAWGGSACAHYVGHDHACRAHCTSPAVCAWRPTLNPTEAGMPYCVCPPGERCGSVSAPSEAAGKGSASAVALVAVSAVTLVALAVCLVLHRRRSAFVHARLSDNVDINNPVFVRDDNEAQRRAASHFENPVYESVYSPVEDNPSEPTDEFSVQLMPGATQAAKYCRAPAS
ncbi:hypothetical protein ACJJTC_013624, partial [Scirpophaga incertulas]